MSQRVAGVPPVVATGFPVGLNQVEIEISVLSRQCLERRIPDVETLCREIQAWSQKRNQQKAKVDWRFAAKDARVKFQRSYPPANLS